MIGLAWSTGSSLAEGCRAVGIVPRRALFAEREGLCL